MGRGNARNEQTGETNDYQEQTTNSTYPFTSENIPSSTRAISESESMARDIKEGRLSGFVGHGTVLTGETNFQAMLRVDGHLTGRVSSENGTLIVGSTGQVDANVVVASAIVSGTINGDIIATERLELHRTARIAGNIQTPRLTMEDGALLEGGCSMIKAKENFDKKQLEKTSPTAASTIYSGYADASEDETEDYSAAETESETETETAEAEETAEAASY